MLNETMGTSEGLVLNETMGTSEVLGEEHS